MIRFYLRSHRSRSRLPIRPYLEILEGRLVLSTLTWKGTASVFWNNANNWTNQANAPAVPANGDALIFPSSAQNKANKDNLPADLAPGSIVINGAYTISLTTSNLDLLSNNAPLSGSGSLTTFGPDTLSLPQNGFTLAQTSFGGPVKIGMSATIPKKPKILAGASLTIGDGPGGMVTLTGLPNIEVDGSLINNGQFATTVLSGNGFVSPGVAPTNGVVQTGIGSYVGANGSLPDFLSSSGLTVGAGGTVSPGGSSSTGPLIVDGSVTFGSGSTLAISLSSPAAGSQSNELFVPSVSLSDNSTPTNDSVDLSGATLALSVAANPGPGPFTIVQAPNITGTFPAQFEGSQFASMADGSLITVNFTSFVIHYTTTAVTLTRFAGPPISLSATPNPATTAKPVALVSSISTTAGLPAPTGTVTFTDGTTFLGTTPVNGSGTSRFLTDSLTTGSHTIIASYSGDANYGASISSAVSVNVSQVVPTLAMLATDDSGVVGDGVTDKRQPHFFGVADPGDTVRLYAVGNNNQLTPVQAMTTASPVDGSYSIQLPYQLFNGGYHLKVQATDTSGNVGPLSSDLAVRIVTVASDYFDLGYSQMTVFRPTSETYIVRNGGFLQVDTTPGRDVPIQSDFNADSAIDLSAYRFDSADYYGFVSNGTVLNQQFGVGSLSLPVPGNYGGTGATSLGLYNPNTGTWAINLPTPGGEVLNFGVPRVDLPVPAAYDGRAVTEIATFRPSFVYGNDADSFNVVAPDFKNNYQISFTNPAVIAKGFTYQAGDIPAPADYDGVGHDEFAVYRPSTGQFFILNVANVFDTSTWTLRIVSLNLPGGPQPGDQPAPADYEGDGKASPTVFRPSNSTFYEIQTTNQIQQNIQFGQPGVDVAAAGPLLYRLSALYGIYGSTDGYPSTASYGGQASFNVVRPPTNTVSIPTPSSQTGTSGSISRASTASIPLTVSLAVSIPSSLPTSGGPTESPMSLETSSPLVDPGIMGTGPLDVVRVRRRPIS